MKPNKQAFTLIELLVVVLIIGILAAAAVPQYQVAVTKSRYATLKSLVTSIVNAQESYYLANGAYASTFETLDVDTPGDWSPSENELEGVVERHFPWGKCQLSTIQTYCATGKIGYQIHYAHATNNAQKKVCLTFDTNKNTIESKVCKQETKDENPTDRTTHLIWRYKN
ncbi:MAG: prepilin-type N-terminal cleavage/methylation domain-containing protein [Elusimicrobiaceae bacterium]|nr:prepilin-type N-terminal cleavage/methylation domain-containing protein [Elusimicrobiaceae bacterium]